MPFLFPLYLLGAAAIAIPLLLHLRRRPPQNMVPFSAMMFLEASPLPPVKRRRLEDILLLLLRCLALILLALMFMRPLWRTPSEVTEAGNAWVILLDRSASMQREDVRAEATRQLEAALSRVEEKDDVLLAAFDRDCELVVDADTWRAQPIGSRKAFLREKAVAIKLGWSSTNLGEALTTSAGWLETLWHQDDSVRRSRRIAVITDLQEGAALEALGAYAWPQDIAVVPFVATAKNSDNFSISPAARSLDAEGVAPVPTSSLDQVKGKTERIRVASSQGNHLTAYTLAWRGDSAPATQGTLAAGASKILNSPPRNNVAGDSVIELRGDQIAFDNQAWFARQEIRNVRLLFIGPNLSAKDPQSALFFLSRALNSNPAIKPEIIAKTPQAIGADDFKAAEIVITTGNLPANTLHAVNEWQQLTGRTLVYLAHEKDDGSTLAALTGLTGLAMTEAKGSYAMLSDLRFDHALLEPFVEAQTRDFTKIRFWKHRVLKLPDKAQAKLLPVAHFDDGSLAIGEYPSGKGRTLIFAFNWTPADSQLPLSSKFIPLLFAVLESSGLSPTAQAGLIVGDELPLQGEAGATAVPVVLPDGKKVALDLAAQLTFKTTQPGIHVVGEGTQSRTYAVNLSPEEGRIGLMNIQRLREFGVRLESEAHAEKTALARANEQAQLEDLRLEERQKLWKYIAIFLLAILLLETFVAGRRESRPQQPSPAA